MRKLLLAIALFATACAPKTIPAPVVTTPRFPDFIRPAVPQAMAGGAAAINEDRGWRFLQSGDLKTAEHEFAAALRNDPRFYPAETSLGYLELARKDYKAALTHFDRVAQQQAADVAALVGRGQALIALDRETDALAAFEAALAADAGLTDIRRRVDVLKFRVSEQEIAHARQAARAGRLDEAARAYGHAVASSPDSPFLYRELAAVERQQDRLDEAIEHLRKAAALDPSDARSLALIGEILEGRDDLDGAMKAYGEAAAIEPDAALERRMEAIRERVALAGLPAEYRAIDQAPQVTRADLAALIGIRLGALLQDSANNDAALITDARANWAQTWIMAVARAGIMEPYANHAFQPRTLVRRADLAQATARLLARVSARRPGAAREWESARLRFADLAPGHLAYPAASVAVAAGAMKVGPDNAFQPSRPVTGQEAIDAVARVESLAGLKLR
jgi:tetratricopeptide (TPR) repeat protein